MRRNSPKLLSLTSVLASCISLAAGARNSRYSSAYLLSTSLALFYLFSRHRRTPWRAPCLLAKRSEPQFKLLLIHVFRDTHCSNQCLPDLLPPRYLALPACSFCRIAGAPAQICLKYAALSRSETSASFTSARLSPSGQVREVGAQLRRPVVGQTLLDREPAGGRSGEVAGDHEDGRDECECLSEWL
ncbi:hypothetical protein DL89DRAFT_74044 [Linderina pennispora]|uniref:Secreted protein n=1 Tax=Linderina pennispora TaxID=61395 RepID=A0A1Y1VQT9_9FUNG|nr:uncharacterized protein DL89DRAFT_74044 [Linderina pennispora]ORX63640.1 hypothetical protein DL89DRAFT_74044 [Linderina pennispora]